MIVKSFEFNPFGEHTYVVWDEKSRQCAIIDPGVSSQSELDELRHYISTHSLEVMHMINTHLHLDHTFGNNVIKQIYGVGTEAHMAEAPLGASLPAQLRRFGISSSEASPIEIDHELADGDKIFLGEEYLIVLWVPGHSPGSIALYCPQSHFVLTGDALFQGSVGRSDLEGGDHETLIASIRGKLLTLPSDTKVYPGHGPATTIDREVRTNPFL